MSKFVLWPQIRYLSNESCTKRFEPSLCVHVSMNLICRFHPLHETLKKGRFVKKLAYQSEEKELSSLKSLFARNFKHKRLES